MMMQGSRYHGVELMSAEVDDDGSGPLEHIEHLLPARRNPRMPHQEGPLFDQDVTNDSLSALSQALCHEICLANRLLSDIGLEPHVANAPENVVRHRVVSPAKITADKLQLIRLVQCADKRRRHEEVCSHGFVLCSLDDLLEPHRIKQAGGIEHEIRWANRTIFHPRGAGGGSHWVVILTLATPAAALERQPSRRSGRSRSTT